MKYTESYNLLKTSFQRVPDDHVGKEPVSGIRHFPFSSKPGFTTFQSTNSGALTRNLSITDDSVILKNSEFTYPVFVPAGKDKFTRAVILLHGLNERSWTKYLPWAQTLADGLQFPVILFPISFHMNRSPEEWSNPRLMSALLRETRLRSGRNRSATFANLALSLRLSSQPSRFFTSGIQSVEDLRQLITSIQEGNHPLFEEGTTTSFFAYSIGAFLAQIMMLTYGESLLSTSRLFILCGGAPFNRMNGVSKLIMDEEAFSRLRFYYLRQFDRELNSKGNLFQMTNKQPAAMAFSSMLDAANLREWRNSRFKRMEDRIQVIGMKNDIIIPPDGIKEIIDSGQLTIIDYPSGYSHENPFPLNTNHEITDSSFEMVFNKAIDFLK
ncbi:MAG: hypothetical protein IPN08_07285 [Bacteroidales bacterium]|nr:hypothetical protein [Bacteroidales bacterium]MBK9357175.1 hypothetical protein [Bacteroidales bacterium]